MNKIILILSLLAISSWAIRVKHDELRSLWGSWKGYYGKSYAQAEEAAKFATFVENHKKIMEFNSKNENAKLALNQFADITGEEFKSLYSLNFLETDGTKNRDSSAYDSDVTSPVTYSYVYVDYRAMGYVTAVKDQGQCDASWAFSAIGALESLYSKNNKKNVQFSEQALIDCTFRLYNQGAFNNGCNGGNAYFAFKYTAANGVATEADYPYTGRQGTCKSTSNIRVNSDFKTETAINVGHLIATLNKNGPLVVGISSSSPAFMYYTSGVIPSSACSEGPVDHAVLLVGYLKGPTEEYFLVKNSWGVSWGEAGYARLSSACNLISTPFSYPIV